MRILFLLENYEDDDRTGAIFYRLCQRWAPTRELTMTTIAFGNDGPLKERLRALGIGAKIIPWRGLRDRKAVRAAGKRLLYASDRPDLIQSMCKWPDLPARFLHNNHPDVPLITSLHDMDFCCGEKPHESIVARFVEKRTRKWVSAFVPCCLVQEKELQRRKVPPEKIHRVSMGVDGLQCFPVSQSNRARFRSLLGVGEEVPLVISAGRLGEGQGFLRLVDAMKHVVGKQPQARLFIIGDGPGRGKLEARVSELGLSENVRLVGHLSSVLAKLFSTADVVVHTCTDEPFPLNVAEAQASGTPVVAFESAGNREVIRDGETGLLVAPGDVKGLADSILMILEDPEMREGMGELAREFVLEKYEIGDSAEKYIALWRNLAPHALWQTTTSMHLDDLEEFKREAAGN